MMTKCQVLVIGAGPAGLAAAVAAYDGGAKDVLILEREKQTGGILNQCVHNGFGLTRFKESLTGPEYAARFEDERAKRNIPVLTETTVLSVSPDRTVTAMNGTHGVFTVQADAIVLAMGCRERSRGALNIAGSRPAGIYSAGTAQKYVNIKGYSVGREVVILGSGDIGLIMARRMTLEGAKVHAVCEIMPYSSGLKRNIAQCLDDFNIPLLLKHTIVEIHGYPRVTGVTVAAVDDNKRPIAGTEKYFPCDTVLFSVGLIPENELTKAAGISLSPATRGAVVYQNRETTVDGIFACGNVLQVHDLVDFVSEEAETAGAAAADFALRGRSAPRDELDTAAGEGISYVLPQKIDRNLDGNVKLFFRVRAPKKDCAVVVAFGGREIVRVKKRVVTPGEMETLTVKKELLSGASSPVTVRLEEGV